MKNEIWKPVIGFETFYEVSNFGNVKSVPNATRYRATQDCGIMSQFLTKYGYMQVTLTIKGIRSLKRVNRLVAESFHPNPENKPCVNHINGVKTDNRTENLEWVTYSENERHSWDVLGKDTTGVKRTFKEGYNPKSKFVLCIETGNEYKSIKEVAIALNLHRANITAQIKGRLKKTGGFTFKFIPFH